MKLTIGENEFSGVKLVKFFGVVIAIIGVIWLMTYQFDRSAKLTQTTNTTEHYKYKADQFRGLIHKIMSVFKERDEKFYDLIATDLNTINEAAKLIGAPLSGDKTSSYYYKLLQEQDIDSTIDSTNTK